MTGLINCFNTNGATELKNYTGKTFYGVSVNNKTFIVTPDDFGNDCIQGFIYISSFFNGDIKRPKTIFDYKMYNGPVFNVPVYIEEMNILLFSTEEELRLAIEKFGSGRILVEAYASKTAPLLNGAYKVVIALSKKAYFTVVNKEIYELPQATDQYIQECIVKLGITKEKLEVSDYFVVETILRNALTNKPNVVAHELHTVKKDQINDKEPILFENTGLFVFSNKHAAERYIEKWGTIEEYLKDKALNLVDIDHKKELDEYAEITKSDKKNMIELFALTSLTSIGGMLIEKGINYAGNKIKAKQLAEAEEATKEVSKVVKDKVNDFIINNEISDKQIGVSLIIGGFLLLSFSGYELYKHKGGK
jgi:hypothetical protein